MQFFELIIFALFAVQVLSAPAQLEDDKNKEKEVGSSYGSASAASYSIPSYSAPAPQLGPSKLYAYHSPAPSVPCGSNLLIGCSPSVQQAPCIPAPSYGPSYGSSYGPSRGHSHGYAPAPAYAPAPLYAPAPSYGQGQSYGGQAPSYPY